MKTKLTAIIIFLLTASAAIPVYYIYRSAYLEKKYIETLESKAPALKPVADKLNSGQTPDSEKLKKIFNELIQRDSSIAALALTDSMDRLRFMAKNDSLLSSAKAVDELVKDIKEKRFSGAGENLPVVKNYSGTDWLTDKLYIFKFSSGGQNTIAVYSFTIDRLTGIRISLEVILLISGIFILTTGILILLRKTGIINDPEEYRIKTIVIGEKTAKPAEKPEPAAKKEKRPSPAEKKSKTDETVKSAAQINEEELLLIPENAPDQKPSSPKPVKEIDEGSADSLNRKVLSLFKKIHKEMSPESISLYIKTTESRLTKSYELKGKSIIRIDSLTYNSIAVADIEKISKPGTYITAGGDTVRVPLIFEGSVSGLIDIEPGEKNSTVNISLQQSEIADMAREINNYIISNNLITDAETGYCSSRYFTAKVRECAQEASSGGREFTLIMINIFAGVDADRKQKDMILKVLHPELKKAAGPKNRVFLHKDCVSLVLNSTERECSSIESALVKEISRFRLKVSDDIILKMNPQSIMRYSADSRDLNNILHEVEALAAVSN
ncbi:MAG TPA: hypothetical protein PKZ64_07805 [Spirochaetota bacterium]|nr:hypothetical protein [Spirochaetota bacterium]HPJ43506.1 hypothetical protein [Spirochaetota bacterium]HPR37269.1 hypothetical protein [Spirochaetota bacterium]